MSRYIVQFRVTGVAGAHPSCHWAPWTGHQSVTAPHRAKRDTSTLTPGVNLESPVNLTWMFVEGGSQRTHRVSTHTRGEHAKPKQKGPSWDSDLL